MDRMARLAQPVCECEETCRLSLCVVEEEHRRHGKTLTSRLDRDDLADIRMDGANRLAKVSRVSNPVVRSDFHPSLGSSSVASSAAASLIRRRNVKFFERSAGGRPIRGSDAQSHTPHTYAVMSP